MFRQFFRKDRRILTKSGKYVVFILLQYPLRIRKLYIYMHIYYRYILKKQMDNMYMSIYVYIICIYIYIYIHTYKANMRHISCVQHPQTSARRGKSAKSVLQEFSQRMAQQLLLPPESSIAEVAKVNDASTCWQVVQFSGQTIQFVYPQNGITSFDPTNWHWHRVGHFIWYSIMTSFVAFHLPYTRTSYLSIGSCCAFQKA